MPVKLSELEQQVLDVMPPGWSCTADLRPLLPRCRPSAIGVALRSLMVKKKLIRRWEQQLRETNGKRQNLRVAMYRRK